MKYSEPLQMPGRIEPPEVLTSRLRVLASREALRRRRRASLGAAWNAVMDSLDLIFDNLMRPYVVPVTGGLISTAVLFGMLAPSLVVNRNVPHDVATVLWTNPILVSSFTPGVVGGDIVVDVETDEQGRVISYSIPGEQTAALDPALIRTLETTLLYTRFAPATFWGQPSLGRTRITLRRSHLDVRG